MTVTTMGTRDASASRVPIVVTVILILVAVILAILRGRPHCGHGVVVVMVKVKGDVAKKSVTSV